LILVDANLLLYAYDASSPRHRPALDWIERAFTHDPVGLAWPTILAFVRIATNARIFAEPYSLAEVSAIVDDWLARDNVTTPVPGPRHWEILQRLLVTGDATGPLAMDADLAALAIEHGAVLCTTDRDFARFPGLRFENPLA
jgi:toxin-antitoxin system PIN domain toxin